MKLIPVPAHLLPEGSEPATFDAPAGDDFDELLHVAVADLERGVRQFTACVQLEAGDLEAIRADGGRFLIRFFGGVPLFILDTISEPSSSGSVVASSPSGRIAGTAVEGELGTTEQMEAPTPPASEVQSGRHPGERRTVVPTSRSG